LMWPNDSRCAKVAWRVALNTETVTCVGNDQEK
jgi:hypothetical protein